MKKRTKYHIIRSWLLLICFAAGQIIVYAHRHPVSFSLVNKHSSAKQVITERCQLCDAMHSSHMELVKQHLAGPAKPVARLYAHARYNFFSISLILAAGRAPPVC